VFGEKDRDANIFARFFFAQFIVSSSETVSYPLDTVRRRLMMQSGRKEIVYSVRLDEYHREQLTVSRKSTLMRVWEVSLRAIYLIFTVQWVHLWCWCCMMSSRKPSLRLVTDQKQY